MQNLREQNIAERVVRVARYIDAVQCADVISEKLNIPLGDLVDVFAEIPTADVVEVKKVIEMLCKIKTAVIQNVSTMIENDFSEIVKDALGERRDT